MTLSKKILIPLVSLGVLLAVMLTMMFNFGAQKEAVAGEERVLRTVQAGVQEVSDYIKVGISTRMDAAAVSSAKTALDVDERLGSLGASGADLRREFADYYVAMVAVNSIFLENRTAEGEKRLDQLKKHAQRIDQDIQARVSATGVERERIIAKNRTVQIVMLLAIAATLLLVFAACLPSKQ